LQEVPLAVCENDENLNSLLNIIRDRKEPIKVRLAALQSLQAASFSVIAFESCRPDYLAALREVVDDPDPELRQRVLGILAREKDSYVQQRLLDGLQNPEKALVPPEKALQLLSYDVHAESYSVARDIVDNPPNPEAKREALRILSADPNSASVFERLLTDKDENREVRQISAAALQATKPRRFQERARQLLLDKDEYDDIQATALTALTQFGDQKEVGEDKELMNQVDKLGKGKSAKVKKTARRFMMRYRP
jgi:HEAT repeat protein